MELTCFTRCSHAHLPTQFIFNQITAHHSLEASPNSALPGHLSHPKPVIPKELAVCGQKNSDTVQSTHGWKRLLFLCLHKGSRAACWSQPWVSKAGVNRYQYISSQLISTLGRAWARQVLTLPWCLSFPKHSCLFRDGWCLQLDRNAGSWRGLGTSATQWHLSGKLSHFLWAFPQLSSYSLLPAYLPGRRLEEGPGQACHQLLVRSQVCEHPPSPCPQQPDGQRPLSTRRCALPRPSAATQTEGGDKKAIYKTPNNWLPIVPLLFRGKPSAKFCLCKVIFLK